MIGMATPFGSFITNGVKDNLVKFNSLADLDLYKDVVDDENGGNGGGETGGNEGGSSELPGEGGGSEDTPSVPVDPASADPGLYQTGSNYTILLNTWEDLIGWDEASNYPRGNILYHDIIDGGGLGVSNGKSIA